uniref:Phosphoprotein n=1 Tax=Raton olivaceo morbillivirus TaxID=2928189 RepID=A0A9N6YK38_9MONO|nr:TPA_asm: phosphoprotein [Raton olivaceo morbillivirus]
MASSDNISINHALNVLKTIKTREESPEEKIKVSAILQECRKSTEGKTLKEAITILPPLTARDHESDEPTISCQTPPNYQGSEKESATRTGSDPTHDRPRRGRILSSPVPYDYVEPAPDGVDTKPDMGCTSHSGYMHNREGEIPVQSGSQLVKGDDSTRPLADSNRNLGDDLLIDSDQWAMPIRLKRRHENPKIEISQHDDEPDSSGDPDSDGREVTQTSKFSSVAPVSPGDFENVGLMKHLDTNKKGEGCTYQVREQVPHIRALRIQLKKEADIGENTILFGQVTGSWLEAGVIRSVHQSNRSPSERNVHAGHAQPYAKNAYLTNRSDSLLSTEQDSEKTFDNDYDESIHDISINAEMNPNLNELLENQKMIISKLDQLLTIKNDIDAIKKQINKQNLALSTIEGHLSSVMMAVPGSGKPYSSVEENPELRPVLGRDQCRGLQEIATPKIQGPDLDGGLQSKNQWVIKKDMYLDPINSDESNATKFLPSNDLVSRDVLYALINSSIRDKTMRSNMLYALETVKDDKDLKEFHEVLLKYLQ